ncbi:DUF4040 domain-containing protein [Roseospirillum parvum]|uniref:Multicomponent Na+:H+ antiporter subunit B n=1 Tax=Roseospirillum parvum TaxID=83401 RepID=A0A1G7XLB5_9PROT|nr:DUF4040 domain-containing protein [Roseospirillum parvum]SDG85015.1 multicomponent Na+:H+ antiporter subunit B [Roseospirillum parvum]
MSAFIDLVLLVFLMVTALAIVRLNNLFAVVMLSGIYSLTSAALFVVLDAVDVAFTEAAVGAGVSTVLALGTLALIGRTSQTPSRRSRLALVAVVVTGAALLYGTADMPAFGDGQAPIHKHVANRYLEESGREVGLPNVVTSVLASYRGYDTLGETTVIFTAGMAVLILLGVVGRDRRRDLEDPGPEAEDGR